MTLLLRATTFGYFSKYEYLILIHLGFTTAYSLIFWLILVYIIKPSRKSPSNLWLIEALKIG
jgi:hypothetical protein